MCRINQKILCAKKNCKICYERSFAFYKQLTILGKLKNECLINNNPLIIFFKSNIKYEFICDVCFHPFQMRISDVTKNKWCPFCSNVKLCNNKNCNFCFNNSLASYKGLTKKSKLKIEYLLDGNPYLIFKKSHKKYNFTCDICSHPFSISISNLISGKWCPYCSKQKLCDKKDCNFCFENSFASYKRLTKKNKLKIECWNYELNNNLNPRNVFKYSNKIYSFICDICEHNFERNLNNILKNNCWCPYCSGKSFCNNKNCKICFNNSFASYKGLTKKGVLKIDCWNYKLNNNITPYNIYIGSKKEFYFKCDICSHNFKNSLTNISNDYSWCNYCIRRKLCSEENCVFCFNNSFASYKGITNKGKLKIKCLKSKIDIKKILIGSTLKFDFVCDICQKPFSTTPCRITVYNNWCPHCKNKTEQLFFFYFSNKYSQYNILQQKKFNWCKNKFLLPFDFCIEELKILIEIDGEQHFTQVLNWTSPEKIFERDKFKMLKAIKNGYSIIRILQNDIYNDLNNWKDELDKSLYYKINPKIILIGCKEKYKKYKDFEKEIVGLK